MQIFNRIFTNYGHEFCVSIIKYTNNLASPSRGKNIFISPCIYTPLLSIAYGNICTNLCTAVLLLL